MKEEVSIMKVLAINGSARKDGNTNFFIGNVLKKIEENDIETECIWLGDKNIHQCTACYKCLTEKKCVIQDDFQDIFEKMVEADGIILGSPSYHATVGANMKALLDRAGFVGRWGTADISEIKVDNKYSWKGNIFSRKIGAGIAVSRRTGQAFTIAEMLLWLSVNDFFIINSDYWNVGVAGVAGSINGEGDTEGIGIMEHLGENISFALKKIHG